MRLISERSRRRRAPKSWLSYGASALLLDVGNAELIRRTHRFAPSAARALVPYTGWCVFATALNGAIVRRNPSHRVS
ncbi:tryptophan-rich sensory protein [Streptomyces sp. NPDC096324]|uniref:tryptophan-rich sensory protein n=1 Tax=Streptomyces sp. NPDC096324 TaxID=3366085 RepID=UPI00380D3CC2